jgi:hypothetical protein
MRTAVGTVAVAVLLAGCSAGGGSSAVPDDGAAIAASGATNCVAQHASSTVVRGEYDCDGGLVVTTYTSPLIRQAMATVTGDSRAGRVVKQADNWMVTVDAVD